MRNRCWLNVTGHFLCAKQDVPCVRSRTFLMFEARHSVYSEQDMSCLRSKTFLVFDARHSLCCERDIPCVPITKNALATFWWIRPIILGFGRIIIRFDQIPGRSAKVTKKWHAKFSNFKRLKNREDGSDFHDFLTKTIAATPIFFSKSSRRRNFHIAEKLCRRTSERTYEQTNERPSVQVSTYYEPSFWTRD